jgi:phenylacetate-CoA ligase
VRELISHCYANVPYYRRVMEDRRLRPDDIRSVADLQKLPLLTKEALRRWSHDLIARNVRSKSLHWTRTGGTTGEPVRVAKDRPCNALESLCLERGLAWGGLQPSAPRIRLFGGSLGIDQTRWTTRIASRLRGEVFLPAFELRVDTAPAFFDTIQRSGARHLIGYASSIYRLAVLAEELGAHFTFDAVFPTAELLLPEWKDVIGRRFACEVLPYYGCGEVNSLGYTPYGSGSYVIPEENCVIEVGAEHGDETADSGEGRFVITSLANFAMPILRYVNGDAGRLGPPVTPFPHARIERIDGRYNSLLLTDSGDLISGVLGTHVFRHLTTAVETYRIIQEEPLRVVIKVVPRADKFSATDEELIEVLFQKHLGPRMRVTVEKVGSIDPMPSGKSVFVINRVLA